MDPFRLESTLTLQNGKLSGRQCNLGQAWVAFILPIIRDIESGVSEIGRL